MAVMPNMPMMNEAVTMTSGTKRISNAAHALSDHARDAATM